MCTDEEKTFLMEFLEVYRTLPSLWNIKTKEYRDKNKKSLQYEVLLEKYREKYPNANKSHVTKKINSLRTNFRRELKRLNNINKSVAGVNKLIEPSLWYFDQISFINYNKTSCTASRGTIQKDEYSTQDEGALIEKKLKKYSDPADELIVLATQRLKQEPDNFKKMADIWASKFLQMNSSQQLYAEKFINEIIFEGVLGNLNRNSVQIIPSHTSTPRAFHSSSPLSEDILYQSNNSESEFKNAKSSM